MTLYICGSTIPWLSEFNQFLCGYSDPLLLFYFLFLFFKFSQCIFVKSTKKKKKKKVAILDLSFVLIQSLSQVWNELLGVFSFFYPLFFVLLNFFYRQGIHIFYSENKEDYKIVMIWLFKNNYKKFNFTSFARKLRGYQNYFIYNVLL